MNILASCVTFCIIIRFITYKSTRFRQEGYVIPDIYLSVCWFVSRITQKVTGGFGWNFQGRLYVAIRFLVVIWVTVWIQDSIEGFYTLDIYRKDFGGDACVLEKNICYIYQVFTCDSGTGRYCWECVLAMGILSVCLSWCHDPVPNQAQVR